MMLRDLTTYYVINKKRNDINRLPKIILASSSPRRAAVLSSLGLHFEKVVPDTVELNPERSKNPTRVVLSNAERKASSIGQQALKNTVIIGCDTIVYLSGKILGKPSHKTQAMSYLRLLSGQWHEVVSGLVLYSSEQGSSKKIEVSKVKFRNLSRDVIRAYCDSSEPYDKAGSYAVQGLSSLFIEKIQGSYTNVMGFPLEKFLTSLVELTHIELPRWIRAL